MGGKGSIRIRVMCKERKEKSEGKGKEERSALVIAKIYLKKSQVIFFIDNILFS